MNTIDILKFYKYYKDDLSSIFYQMNNINCKKLFFSNTSFYKDTFTNCFNNWEECLIVEEPNKQLAILF